MFERVQRFWVQSSEVQGSPVKFATLVFYEEFNGAGKVLRFHG